jgi:hypothetical protein
MTPKEAEPVVRLSVNLPVELHGAIRATAISKGQTITEYVRAALETAYAVDRYGTAERKKANEQ